MSDVNKTIEVQIKVVNNAKGELSKVSSDVKRVTDEVAKQNTVLEKSAISWKTVAQGVIGGQAAYDLIARAASAAVGFIRASWQEADEAEVSQRRLAQVLYNSSDATRENVQALFDQAEMLERVGVVSAEVVTVMQEELASFDLSAEAVKNLTPALADYTVAVAGINPTSEAARNAATGFGKALQGQYDILIKKGYKTAFTDATKAIFEHGTEQERVAELVRITGSNYEGLNETLRKTEKGGIVGLQFALDKMKETIGVSLKAALSGSITDLSKFASSNVGSAATTEALGKTVYNLTTILVGLGKATLAVVRAVDVGFNTIKTAVSASVVTVSTGAAKIAEGFKFIGFGTNESVQGLKNFAEASKDTLGSSIDKVTGKGEKFVEQWKDIGVTLNKVSEQDYQSLIKSMQDSILSMEQQRAKTAQTKEVTDAQKDAIKKQKEEVEKLNKAYGDITGKMSEFSIESEADFKKFAGTLADTKTKNEAFIASAKQGFDALASKINKTADEIKGLEDKLQSAKDAFADFIKSTGKEGADTFAGIIIDAEKAIPDLQAKISKLQGSNKAGSNDDEIANLQKELSEKQSVITSANTARYANDLQLQTELTFLRENNKRNELDASYEILQRKIADRTEEYNNEVKIIQDTITQKTMEKEAFTLLQQQASLILKQNVDLRAKYINTEKINNKSLQSSVESLTASYLALASAMAKAGASKNTSTASGLAGARADGGSVSSGSPYLVGERGPEIFVPAQNGSITPNDRIGSGGINVVINNPTVRSDSDLQAIIQAVSKALGRQQELANYGAYK